MSPIRHVTHGRPLDTTLAGEALPGPWRYSSRLGLVLSGGGARGAYQVGVVAGLAERLPGLEFPILTGVSAGAINTAYLAAHPGPLRSAVEGLAGEWRRLTSDQVFSVRPARMTRSALHWLWQGVTQQKRGPATVRGLVDTAPLRAFLENCLDMKGIDANVAIGRLRAVALTAVSYASGQAVTFVHGDRDGVLWTRSQRSAVRTPLTLDHVMASAAVPIVFPAIRMGEEFYGDGGIGALAPLSPAIRLGARGIVAVSTAAATAEAPAGLHSYPTVAEVVGLLFRAIFVDALETDAERLERVNRLLAALPEGTPAPDGLKPVELLVIKPSRNLSQMAGGRESLLPPAMRQIVRAFGGARVNASEFLAYLLFHPEYTSPLAEIGYEDVGAQWPAIEQFFERLERRG